MPSDPNKKIAKSRSVAKPSSLMFPTDGEIGANRFLLSFSTYKGALTGSKLDPTKQRTYTTHKICLPLPQGLDNNFAVQYDTSEFGIVGGIALKVLQNKLGIEEALTNADTYAGVGSEFERKLGSGTTQAVFDIAGNNSGSSFFNSQVGSVANPNLATTFQGVGIRSHQFSWRFTPKNKAESTQLRTIIKILKQAALPARNAGQNYTLLYPDIAHITISGSANKMIDFPKNGMFLKDIGIKYDGVAAAFYKDTGEPVVTDLSLSFIDRSIVTREDVT